MRACVLRARRTACLAAVLLVLAGTAARAEAAAPAPAASAMQVQAGHPSGDCMAASRDGKLLAFSGSWQGGRFVADATLRTADGRLLRVMRTGLDDSHARVDLSSDGGLLAVSGRSVRGCAVELYDTASGAAAGAITDTPMTKRMEAVFLPDGKGIAACGSDADGGAFLQVYDLNGAVREELTLPDGSEPSSLVTIPGGKKVACLFSGARFAVIDLDTGDGIIVEDPDVAARKGSFISLAADPEGKALAVCADVKGAAVAVGMAWKHAYPLSLWSVDGALIRRLREEGSETDGPAVGGLCFLPDGALLMALNGTRVRYLGDYVTNRALFTLIRHPPDGGAARAISDGDGWINGLSTTGGRITAACADRILSWDPDGARPAAARTGWTMTRAFISFSPDGSRFLTGPWPVRLWNADGRLEREISLPEGVFAYSGAFSPDGQIVLAHSKGIDVRSVQGVLLRHFDAFEGWERHAERIRTDGRHVFVPVTDDTVMSVDAGSFSVTALGSAPGPLIEPSADGAWVAQLSGLGYGDVELALRGPGDAVLPGGIVKLGDASAVGVSPRGTVAWVQPGRSPGFTGVLHLLIPGGAETTTALTGVPVFNVVSPVIVAVSGDAAAAVAFRDRPDVRLVRPDGSQADLHGAGAGLLALAFSPDGKRLAAVGADDTVRTWNLATAEAVSCAADGGEWVAFTDDGWFDASADGGRLLAMVRGREAYGIEQMALYRNRPDILLSRLGVGSDEERELYFRRHVWRLVKAGLVPQSIPSAEFEKTLVQPSDAEGRARLKACYQWKADAYQLRAESGLAERIALFGVPAFLARVEAGLAAGGAPPIASIAGSMPAPGGITLSCSFRSTGRPLKAYTIYVDGVPVFPGSGEPLSGTKALVTKTVTLPPGPCRVEVACSDAAMTESPRVGLDADGGPRGAGTLWYIGFGVSEYANPDLRLLYPGKDVRDMRDALLAEKGGWRDVKAWAFTDAECTVAAVGKAKGLLAAARPGDTVVLFVSGHGLHDTDPDSTYYYLTHEADLSDLPRTAVSFSTIESILDGIAPTRKLFLMDTCESGEYDEVAMSAVSAVGASHAVVRGIRGGGAAGRGIGRAAAPRVYVLENDRYIHRDLFQRTGAVVFSSSRAGEFSYEPDEYAAGENGFFTGAVLKALTTPVADGNGDGVVTAVELRAYVAAAVADRSDGCQHPTVDRDNPSASIGFPLPEAGAARMTPADAGAYLIAAARSGSAAVVRSVLALSAAPARITLARDVLDRALVATASTMTGPVDGARDCVKALLAAGADPDAADTAGIPAAVAAWRAGRSALSVVLVQAGARMPAFMVAESSADAAAKKAVDAAAARGARVDRTDLQEAFWWSVQLGDPTAALLLLRAGADFFDERRYRDAVTVAHDFGFPKLEEALARQRDLNSALMDAAAAGDSGRIRAALSAGAFMDMKLEGRAPLMAAAGAGRAQAVSLLLGNGAEPDERGVDGVTALMEAARSGSADCVRLLLAAGADPNARLTWGDTALSLAVKGGFTDAAGLLRACGAR